MGGSSTGVVGPTTPVEDPPMLRDAGPRLETAIFPFGEIMQMHVSPRTIDEAVSDTI